ncbi:MAG: hypothetical protein AAGI01_18150, partial [Myxococcota bacterium]
GAAPQRISLLDSRTSAENLALPLVARGDSEGACDAVDAVLHALDLARVRDVPVRALTHTERVALCIGRACIGSPELILVDAGMEALSGALRTRAGQMLRRCHRHGATVVLFGREASGLAQAPSVELRVGDGAFELVDRLAPVPSPEAVMGPVAAGAQ